MPKFLTFQFHPVQSDNFTRMLHITIVEVMRRIYRENVQSIALFDDNICAKTRISSFHYTILRCDYINAEFKFSNSKYW